MKTDEWNRRAVISSVVCMVLALVGFVRLLSYSRGYIGDTVRHSVVGFLAYNPHSLVSAQFFKILATPSVVALIYFFFRRWNANVPFYAADPAIERANRLDFESPVLRLILTSIITVHWLAMEWWKFHVTSFYPWSPLENRALNIVVLLSGQALAFWAMRYLSFEPILRNGTGPVRDPRETRQPTAP